MAGGSTPAPNAFNVVPIGSHNTIYGSNEVKPGSSNPFTSSGGNFKITKSQYWLENNNLPWPTTILKNAPFIELFDGQ